jgi:uncharacterized protein (DUF488 family)
VTLNVWTVGHSTHPLADFVSILARWEIEALVDVRRFPGSRRQPHFESAALRDSLAAAGVAYLWLPSLGGRRRPLADSVNGGWRNDAFRGYADHLASEEFAEGFVELLMTAHGLRTAVMCAEVLWWRCHRRLIADVLMTLGANVIHIMGEDASQPHRLAAPAHLDPDGRLSYAARL